MVAPVLGGVASKAFTITQRFPQFSGTNGQISHVDGALTAAGMKVSEEGALRIAAAWIANTVIADEVSTLIWKLLLRGDMSREPVQPPAVRPLWDRPNPDQTQLAWLATTSLSLTLHGVSFTFPGWTNGGRLDVLWPIDPANASLKRLDDQSLALDVPGKGTLTNRPGQRPEFMMIPLYQLPGRLEPVSPVRYAAELLGLSQAYDRTAARLMGRGLNPSAVVTVGEKLDPVDARDLSDRLSRLHGGADNAGKVAVLGGKDVKLERLTMTMADAEFLAQRQDVFNVVMALWRVPPTVAGMVDKPSTWGTGIAEFSRGLERFTLRPIVQRIQASVEQDILKWVNPDLQFRGKFDALLSAAPKERAEIQRQNIMAGVTSVERVLAQNDEPPFSEGETVYSPLAQALEEDRELERLRRRAQAYAALIQAGVEPDAAAAASGFDPNQLTHTGAEPTTTRPNEE